MRNLNPSQFGTGGLFPGGLLRGGSGAAAGGGGGGGGGGHLIQGSNDVRRANSSGMNMGSSMSFGNINGAGGTNIWEPSTYEIGNSGVMGTAGMPGMAFGPGASAPGGAAGDQGPGAEGAAGTGIQGSVIQNGVVLSSPPAGLLSQGSIGSFSNGALDGAAGTDESMTIGRGAGTEGQAGQKGQDSQGANGQLSIRTPWFSVG